MQLNVKIELYVIRAEMSFISLFSEVFVNDGLSVIVDACCMFIVDNNKQL